MAGLSDTSKLGEGGICIHSNGGGYVHMESTVKGGHICKGFIKNNLGTSFYDLKEKPLKTIKVIRPPAPLTNLRILNCPIFYIFGL